MSVVFDRPYEFIPPYKRNLWPTLIQKLRLYDIHLRRKEGVVGYRCEGLEHFRKVVDDPDVGILLAPNHCRYADPLVLGWPAREVGTHLHALASWHLFNKNAFETFAIRRMGAYTLNREAPDRKSLDASIEILVEGDRPLIVFPEGATYRTNDVLKPLMDGTAFIARSAARRAAKLDRRVVILPAVMKYLCEDPVEPWATEQLDVMERRFGLHVRGDLPVVERTIRMCDAALTVKEFEHGLPCRDGTMPERRDRLMEHVLARCEQILGIDPTDGDVGVRVSAIRAAIVNRYFADGVDDDTRRELKRLAAAAEDVLSARAFPAGYLSDGNATDTRLVETIQRLQESLTGKADNSMHLSVVIRFDEAIPVPAEKPPRGVRDPLLDELETSLRTMVDDMSALARRIA